VAAASPYPLRRQRNLILATLAVLSVAAWAVVVWQATATSDMSMGLTLSMSAALFIAVWVAMMAAMMFPAAAPMILVFARVQAGKQTQGSATVPTWLFAGAYLLVWTAAGVVAYFAALAAQAVGDRSDWLMQHGLRMAGVLLIGSGIYQLTPLKRVCLAKCRSPIAFVMTSWKDGRGGAVRMGLSHGLFCLGCCWLLFVILFPLGMMNIAALAAITLLIFAEKSLPFGDKIAWVAAAGLVAYGLAVIIHPDFLPMTVTQHPKM
jgi:predicted metal-binding membrane protein